MMNVEKLLNELTLEEKASLCSGQDFWRTQTIERLNIPSVMMSDGPNGIRKQEGAGDHLGINESIKATCFPSVVSLASSFDRELAEKTGKMLGNQYQAENVAMLLGPGVNIKRSPLGGRNFEYFSEDPYQSSEMASAYINGVQSKGIAVSVKHFAVNNQETQRLTSNSIVSERPLNEIYLANFENIIKKSKPRSVMSSYNKINGTFASENHKLLTTILRNKWDFEGFVVTDWGAVKNRIIGLQAGLDLEMPGGLGSLLNDQTIIEAVKNGKLDISILDNTVKRILTFIHDYLENRNEEAVYDREKDYLEVVKIAEECAVLLKNDQATLPLKKRESYAFIGEFVEKPRYQGNGSSYINSYKAPTIAELTKNNRNITYAKGFNLSEDTIDEKLFKEAMTIAQESETVVIFAGLPHRIESEGFDRKNLKLPDNQNELIKQLCRLIKKVVVVLVNGSAVEMPWKDDVSAILEMYLPGDGGSQATLNLLFGEVNPNGKLAETFPLKLEDNPSYINFPGDNSEVEYGEGVYVGYRYYDKKKVDVLFPFGHGLSYTNFEYSNLRISNDSITSEDMLRITLSVTNMGDVYGKEVVQCYVGQEHAQVSRPEKELKAFEKIGLESKETKDITFTLDNSAFAYYEKKIDDWFTPSGQFNLLIGSSSRDIRLNAKINVETTQVLPLVVTRNTTIGEIIKFKGKDVLSILVRQPERDSGQQETDAMGEAGEELRNQMMLDMPLSSLTTFGRIIEADLEKLINFLNFKDT